MVTKTEETNWALKETLFFQPGPAWTTKLTRNFFQLQASCALQEQGRKHWRAFIFLYCNDSTPYMMYPQRYTCIQGSCVAATSPTLPLHLVAKINPSGLLVQLRTTAQQSGYQWTLSMSIKIHQHFRLKSPLAAIMLPVNPLCPPSPLILNTFSWRKKEYSVCVLCSP